MKRAINSVKRVYCWLIWERTSRIWQAGRNRQNRTARTGLPKIGFLNLIWLRVLALGSQNPPLGPLKHLKLIPDSAERHFGPPQLNCSPLVNFFWGFSWHVLFYFTGLESAKDLLLHERMPNKKYLS
jgi:hypothetical protein